MEELFRTTFKNGVTATVTFDESAELVYRVIMEVAGAEERSIHETNSPTSAFSVLAGAQRLEIEE